MGQTEGTLDLLWILYVCVVETWILRTLQILILILLLVVDCPLLRNPSLRLIKILSHPLLLEPLKIHEVRDSKDHQNEDK